MKLVNNTDKFLGVILLGDKALVSDPCYELSLRKKESQDSIMPLIENVKPGLYKAFLSYDTEESNRVSRLYIIHDDLDINKNNFEFICPDYMSCVDSGQSGIYNYAYYKDLCESDVTLLKHHNWYDDVSDLTYRAVKNEDYLSEEEFNEKYNTIELLKEYVKSEECSEVYLESIMNALSVYDDYPDSQETIKKLVYMTSYNLYQRQNMEYIYEYTGSTVDDRCVVSSTGIGDGSYPVFLSYDESGLVDSIQIIYLPNDYDYALSWYEKEDNN